MNKHIYIQNVILIVLGILLISLTVGLRYYEGKLDLLTSISKKPLYLYRVELNNLENEKTNINEDAFFEKLNIKPESNIISLDAFFKKGNYIEFDVNTENKGIRTIELASSYLIGTDDSTIKYELTIDGKEVKPGEPVYAKSNKKMHVKIYREGDETKEKQYNLSLVLNYKEK